MATLNQEIVAAKVIRKVRKGKRVSLMKEMQGVYSPTYANASTRLKNSKGFQQLLDKYLPEELLLKEAKAGLKATFTDKYNTDEIDYAVRHKYIETGLKLRGKLKDNEKPSGDTTNNFLVIGGDQLKRIASRVLDGDTASETASGGLSDSNESKV